MRDRAGRELAVEGEVGRVLAPGESVQTPRPFLVVHRGDHFGTLADVPAAHDRAAGCGFPSRPRAPTTRSGAAGATSATFTPAQIDGHLAQGGGAGLQLGGDRRRLADGGGRLAPRTPRKFPGGDADMRALTGEIRRRGAAADVVVGAAGRRPGHRAPEGAPGLAAAGSRRQAPQNQLVELAITSARPTPPVQAATRELATRMLRDWGFDGPQARRPAPQRRAPLPQPRPRPRPTRASRSRSCRSSSS